MMTRKKEIKMENYLEKVPAIRRDLDWNENNGLVTVVQKNSGFYNKIAQKFFGTPKESNIDLDELGSFIWLSIDGKRNIIEIGEMLKEEFGEDAEPLYPRLVKFMQVLVDVKYIDLI